MKVVIDTNIWVSFLIGKLLSKLIDILFNEKIEIITSETQINELIETISKPKIQKYISILDINRLFLLFDTKTIIVEPKQKHRFCRDPKDDFLLDIALESSAEYIVTGDKDLLTMNPFGKIKIITYKEFENILISEF
ncbi:MAG: putative toxin-antitoxin system toxin component, PIN family [Bacteroidetes bacterium]|nr:putative toxin-antitoxin system toxin component, PIN family [Bacteroidota bacterium]